MKNSMKVVCMKILVKKWDEKKKENDCENMLSANKKK